MLQARDRNEFRDEVVRFGRALGFETVSAIAVVDHGIGRSDFVTVDNTPREFLNVFNDPRAMQRDPVMESKAPISGTAKRFSISRLTCIATLPTALAQATALMRASSANSF